jgi:hypothetical protein
MKRRENGLKTERTKKKTEENREREREREREEVVATMNHPTTASHHKRQ